MIGITRRSDDSDSDWDSVSENVQQASGDARYALDQRAVLDNTNGNNNDPFKGVKGNCMVVLFVFVLWC